MDRCPLWIGDAKLEVPIRRRGQIRETDHVRPDLLRGSVDFGGRQDFVKWKCPNATFGSCEDRQQTDRNEDHDRLLRFNCCDHETDQRTEDRHSTGDRQQHCQADYSFEGEEEEDHPTEKDREFRDENARFPGS